ncbi:hypothetical protein RhiirB3_461569 [Rhizophagus irregularis]|nr:hypothetical protein RhiirB3_461569 [Rhizophagus irregularis]
MLRKCIGRIVRRRGRLLWREVSGRVLLVRLLLLLDRDEEERLRDLELDHDLEQELDLSHDWRRGLQTEGEQPGRPQTWHKVCASLGGCHVGMVKS